MAEGDGCSQRIQPEIQSNRQQTTGVSRAGKQSESIGLTATALELSSTVLTSVGVDSKGVFLVIGQTA